VATAGLLEALAVLTRRKEYLKQLIRLFTRNRHWEFAANSLVIVAEERREWAREIAQAIQRVMRLRTGSQWFLTERLHVVERAVA
jgi:hypothetical protein